MPVLPPSYLALLCGTVAATVVSAVRADASVADYPQPTVTTVVDTPEAARPCWSPDGQWIVYDDYESPGGYTKIYRIHPDGGGRQSLTTGRSEVPKASGGPSYGPSPRYMLFGAEKVEHGPTSGTITNAGAGIYNDIAVLDHQTNAITLLTDVGSGLSGEAVGGVLYPRFSPSGSQVAWGDFERPVSGKVFGDWRLGVADFIATPTPHLANIRYYDPCGVSVYEVTGWTPDGTGILFAGTALSAQHEYTMDLCRYAPATEALTRLTRTSGLNGEPAVYEEQGVLSSRGDLLAVMSSAGHPIDYAHFFLIWLQTDLWIAAPDGTSPLQVSFYNTPGTPQYAEAAGRVMISEMGWDAPGTKLVARTYFVREQNDIHDDRSQIRIYDFTPAATTGAGTASGTISGTTAGGTAGGTGGETGSSSGGCGLGGGLAIITTLACGWARRSRCDRRSRSDAASCPSPWSRGSVIGLVMVAVLGSPMPASASSADYPLPTVTIAVDSSHAGRPHWSADGQWIVYDDYETPPPGGKIKIYRVRPDGTGRVGLTTGRSEVPGHSGCPSYHPSGRFLLFGAEMPTHGSTGSATLTDAGAGIYNNVAVLDHTTNGIHILTDVGSGTGGEGIGGTLFPRFNPAGTRIAWGDFEGTVAGGVFGNWRLAIADFVATPQPHLENIRYYDPAARPSVYEVQGWTPDGSAVVFAGTMLAGQHEYTLDLNQYDPSTGQLTRLTKTSGLNGEPAIYEEQGVLSSRGDLLAVMSCEGHPVDYGRFFVAWLQTDLWMADADGGSRRQATFFNVPGHAQHTEAAGRVMIASMGFDPSGLKLAARTYLVHDESTLADDESQIRVYDFTPPAQGTTTAAGSTTSASATGTAGATGGGGSGGSSSGCGLGGGTAVAVAIALALIAVLRSHR
jgi:Tol biopolymer transport system component